MIVYDYNYIVIHKDFVFEVYEKLDELKRDDIGVIIYNNNFEFIEIKTSSRYKKIKTKFYIDKELNFTDAIRGLKEIDYQWLWGIATD